MSHHYPFNSLCHVDGQWLHSHSGNSVAVHDPANRQVIGHVPLLDHEQIVATVDAAQRAFPAWRQQSLDSRAALLRRWAELMLEHQEALARILSEEQGKPLAEARGEIAYAASFIPWFAEEARRLNGQTIPSHIPGAQLSTLKEPVGSARCSPRGTSPAP